jgi:apolipoprotein N-acyltransferase
MKLPSALGLTSASALLFALAFPPMAWKPVAWIALVPFFVALRSVGFASSLLLALVWSTFIGYATGEWLPRAVSGYFAQTRLLGALFFFLVCYTMLAPYYMAFAPTVRFLARHGGLWTPLLVAASWTSVELGRGRLFNGTFFYFGSTPWATFGYSQLDIDPLVQIASSPPFRPWRRWSSGS